MNDPQDILFGVSGQTLFLDAPEGRPTSVTSVQVFSDEVGSTGTAESATTGSPSVESYSTTLNASSGDGEADPTKLNVTTVTGLVRGRQYLLASVTIGHREIVEIAHIDTASADAYLKAPLLNPYLSGDTFVSTRMQVSVSDSWAADVSKLSEPMCPTPRWRAEWTYVVAGVTYRTCSWFDLVRFSAVHTVTPADVDGRFPGWLQRLPTDERTGQGERLIREAYREVAFNLLEYGKADYAQRNSYLLNRLVLFKARVLSAEANFDQGGVDSETQLSTAKDEYERRFNLIRSPKVNQQVTADGAGGVPPRAPLWSK